MEQYEKINYYLVVAKCGHVGKGNYLDVTFPVYAKSAHAAAQMILKRPKVKKHLKNAITSVEEIDYESYLEQINYFEGNGFIKAHTKDEVVDYLADVKALVKTNKQYKKSFSSRKERVFYQMKKNQIKEALMIC